MTTADFSWRRVRGAAAARAGVPAGVYAGDVVDQHMASWCGSCYLVAAVQAVEDCAHIHLARHSSGGCVLHPTVSLQVVMDHFQEYRAEPGWNACQGGFPLHVLRCLRDGSCPLVLEARRRPTTVLGWFPRALRACRVPDADCTVRAARRLAPAEVEGWILKHGPVVLECSSDLIKSADAAGVARDPAARPPNHAVSVVGWRTVEGLRCWVVRNSWGTSRVPTAIPEDFDTCVRIDRNECRPVWQPWRGTPDDPGFLLVPCHHPSLHTEVPSPWIGVVVGVRG